MSIRIPSLAVLLIALAVGTLAIYRANVVIAAICLSIAAAYVVALIWRWRNRKEKE